MTRKIARFTNQEGFGLETTFTADICQGNFDHHGSWTMQKYHERLFALSGGSSSEAYRDPKSKREAG